MLGWGWSQELWGQDGGQQSPAESHGHAQPGLGLAGPWG